MTKRLIVLSMLAALTIAAGCAPTCQPEDSTEYMAILMDGKKIGHTMQSRAVADGKVTTIVDMHLAIGRGGTALVIRQKEMHVETAKGKPISFKTFQNMGALGSESSVGTVDADGKCAITITKGGRKRNISIDWPEGALMSEGLRLLSVRKGLAEGTTYAALVFEPSLRKAMACDVTVGGKAKVDLFGREVTLTKVTTAISMGAGKLNTVTYTDDKFNALKSVVSMMGMNLEMIACPKAFALSPNEDVDFLAKTVIASPQPLGDVSKVKSITYQVTSTGKGGEKLVFIEGAGQKVVRGANRAVTLTVTPVRPAAGVKLPYKGKDKAALAAMKPSRYVESDDKDVIALARKAVGDTTDAAEAIRKIEKFVGDYIIQKNLAVGYASAAEVVKSKSGDCSEHAVLTAAMCRAVGVPAEVVTGMVYAPRWRKYRHAFIPHAWVRAYVGDKWVGVDAAAGPYGAGHIAIAAGNGDPEGFFQAINTMGNFKIASVKIAK